MVAKSCIQAPHLYRWKRAQLQRSCSEKLRQKKHGIYKTLFLYLTRWTPWPIQYHFSILNSNAFDSSRWSGISCIWHCLLHQINAYHKAIWEYFPIFPDSKSNTVNTACSKFLCSFCKICCKTWVKIELCHWQKTLSKCLHSKGIPTFYHLQRSHEFKAGSIRAAIVLQNANFTCGWMQLIFVHVWWPQTGWPQTGQQRPRCCLCRNIESCPPRIGTVAACVLKIHCSQALTVALRSSLIDLHIAHVSSWRPQISCSASYFCCIGFHIPKSI